MLLLSPDHRLDSTVVGMLDILAAVLAKENVNWFMVGAAARDLLLTGVYGIETGRATRDVDVAIAVEDWRRFETVKRALIATGTFEGVPSIAHRLVHGSIRGHPLDIIPFGGIEREGATIAWPPELTEVMSVAGYKEAFDATVEVQITPVLRVRVVSLPGLAVLKIFAWHDRGTLDAKDAVDLALLLRRYSNTSMDRIYDEPGLIEQTDYDVDLAGARLLGRDVRQVLTADLVERVAGVIASTHHRLIARIALTMPQEDSATTAEALVREFGRGLRGE